MNLDAHFFTPLSSRRQMIQTTAATLLGVSISPLAQAFAAAGNSRTAKAQHVIHINVGGAMSHIDTFDPKPERGSEIQGDVKTIDTSIPGVKFGEFLPNLAAKANELAVIRSMYTETADHFDATYLMATGYKKIASIRHPDMASWTQKIKGKIVATLPASVVIGGQPLPGYLGAEYAAIPIGNPEAGLENRTPPGYLSQEQFDLRMKLSEVYDKKFKTRAAKNTQVVNYDTLYADAIKLLKSEEIQAFDISKEPDALKERYGKTQIGQGALLARRLVQNGVQYVNVHYGGWDMHNNLYDSISEKAPPLDVALSTLLEDLKETGLIKSTLVVLTTEFGRKPVVNVNAGRDHHPAVFSCLMAGAGIKVGQVYGESDEDGHGVGDNGVEPGNFNATIGAVLGIPHDLVIHSPDGRPFTIGHEHEPVAALLA